MKVRWTSLSEPRFFGLTANSPQQFFNLVKKNVLEEIFFCVYYGRVSFSDAHNMPAQIRKWWVNKTIEIINANNEAKRKNQPRS